MNIDEYCGGIERSLRQNPHVASIDDSLVCLASDEFNGLIRANAFSVMTTLLTIPKSLPSHITSTLGRPIGWGQPINLACIRCWPR